MANAPKRWGRKHAIRARSFRWLRATDIFCQPGLTKPPQTETISLRRWTRGIETAFFERPFLFGLDPHPTDMLRYSHRALTPQPKGSPYARHPETHTAIKREPHGSQAKRPQAFTPVTGPRCRMPYVECLMPAIECLPSTTSTKSAGAYLLAYTRIASSGKHATPNQKDTPVPHWSTTPPDRSGPRPLPIIRTPVGKSIVATILSDAMLGCPTHFWGGRTTPCEAPDCPACNAGSPTRWHGYLIIFSEQQRTSAILEIPDAAAEQLTLLAHSLPTLRGAKIKAVRTKATRNARVLIELQPPSLEQKNLPRAADLQTLLAMIWKLPTTAVSASPDEPNAIALRIDEEIMRKRNGKPLPTQNENVQR